MSFTVNITDNKGIVIRTENSATASIRVSSIDPGKQVYLTGNNAFAVDGVFNFTGLRIIAEPGSSFKLELTVNLKSDIDQTKYFTTNKVINVFSRLCMDGEQYTKEETCETCPAGTYLMKATTQVH